MNRVFIKYIDVLFNLTNYFQINVLLQKSVKKSQLNFFSIPISIKRNSLHKIFKFVLLIMIRKL